MKQLTLNFGGTGQPPTNADIADLLDHIGAVLETQAAGPFRIRAYHRAADTIRAYSQPIADLATDLDSLVAIPTIGAGMAETIAAFVATGRTSVLDRLNGDLSPEHQFSCIPGIGPKLAAEIHEDLGIDTLEELEIAAHDGRLESLPGIGDGLVRTSRAVLADILGPRQRHREKSNQSETIPSVATLLEIDAEYRSQAARGTLKMIAPKRFNPNGKAWLPVLHTEINNWHLTALFSNTARAHKLNRTNDWVILFYERDGIEGQATIVTESQGPQRGQRVVRGREAETG